jgi:hypothetical protein
MAVLVAAMETLLTPWNALEQYRYSYCNVASHSHQHVVQVDYVMLPTEIPRFLCICLVLPVLGSNPWFVLLPILHLLCLASLPSESASCPLAFLHSCIGDFQWSRWLFMLVMLDGYGYIFYVRLCG